MPSIGSGEQGGVGGVVRIIGAKEEPPISAILLIRVFLPVVLVACSIVRPCASSFLYLLLYLCLPFVGIKLRGYLRILLVLTTLAILSQFVFQIVLLSLPPYGYFLDEIQIFQYGCKNITMGTLFQQFSLIPLSALNALDIMRWVLPDLVLFAATTCVYYYTHNKTYTKPKRLFKSVYKKFGSYVTLTLFLVTAALEPSIINSAYYLIFLFGCTAWSLNIFSKRILIFLFAIGSFNAFLQILATYVYQISLGRLFIDFNFNMRLLGLVDFVEYDCTKDDRVLVINDNLKLSTWLSPVAILLLFHLTVYQIYFLLRKDPPEGHYKRRRAGSERVPLMVSGENNYGSIIEQQQQHQPPPQSSSRPPSTITTASTKHLQLFTTALLKTLNLFIKSSYIGTNIIMMAWSITYHSWLTFILLIAACLLWMFPNQRRAMLLSSPILVIYAEILLLIQYVYCLQYDFPKFIDGINLTEIGLAKDPNCFKAIMVKSCYAVMFWITLRQYVTEKTTTSSLIENAAQESFRVVVSNQPELIVKGKEHWLKSILIKLWIWVVAIMLFIIGLGGGDKVVLYRIVYMALFLVFIITFQLSYNCWRRMLYSFWLTVIIYSMLVLVLIYTYQFEDIPQYLNKTGIPEQLQKDIGLEKFDTGDLFVRLLTPTFFLIITVIQLHYFHKDFLKISEIIGHAAEEAPPEEIIVEDNKNFTKSIKLYAKIMYKKAVLVYKVGSEICWKLLEIHIGKIVITSVFILSVFDKSLLHFPLCIFAVIATVSLQTMLIHLCSIYICILFLLKMIYQIDYIEHSAYNNDGCNATQQNDAEWLGFFKIDGERFNSLISILSGYIGLIAILTLQGVIKIRRQFRRRAAGTDNIVFPNITRPDADKGLIPMVQFLVNYIFHKFGVETTLVTLVLVIGTRLDFFSVLYSAWLVPMFWMSRKQLQFKIWMPFITFLTILLPLQYLSSVGIPPFLCVDYPWTPLDPELKGWLFLPDFVAPPDISRLVPDFILLLICTCQHKVFRAEEALEGEAGSNDEILSNTVEGNLNPTPDFLSTSHTVREEQKTLNSIKKSVLLSFYWLTLGIIFLTGTNRVNLFALGYLVGSFIFLWEGNEFYLREKVDIIKRWNILLSYNVFVICIKCLLQLVGCVFLPALQYNFCWLIQLFGIACLNKFKSESSYEINRGLLDGSSNQQCDVPHDEAGMVWDGITFAFLILQRRIFFSYYFFHIRAETEVQAKLASRGAELIEELMQNQIRQQEEVEKQVLEKIKMKMDRIKATHDKQNNKDNHFDAIRSGDYYMFNNEDDNIGMIDDEEDKEDDEEVANKRHSSGVTISELMSTALKTGDVAAAATRKRSFLRKASRASVGEEDEIAEEEDDGGEAQGKKPTVWKRLYGYMRFSWALVESLMVSMTSWLDKFSKDYRHVSKCLTKERSAIKEQDSMSSSSSSENIDESRDDLQTVIDLREEVEEEEEEKSNAFIKLVVSLWYVIISHSDLVCYFVVFLNQIKSASILSLPLPLMVLLWGSLSVPRPTKTFWVTIIAYTEAMVVLKYLFQFDFFPWNGKAIQVKKDPFWPPKILGIEKQEKYAVYDVVLLMVVFFHRFMLKSLGLWKNNSSTQQLKFQQLEQQQQQLMALQQEHQARLQQQQTNSTSASSSSDEKLVDRVLWEEINYFSYVKLCVTKYVSSIQIFFSQILNLEYKVKVDVYSYMFMCDFFNFLVVIFGFASFGSQDGDVSRYLEENKVPVPFLVMVILQFALIVIDRALYLRKDIMGKFFFQIALATFVHIAMFFILPSVTERDFNANLPPQMWYFVKCIYLLLSAYQIRSGYPTRILGNFLCKKYNYLNMFLFKGFMAVPFLFELRALMDWIWTETSMTLSDWLKLEDIFAHIFQLKCQRRVEQEYPQGRGQSKPRWSKYTIGGGSLFLIIAIIWFPLVLFALGNTVGIANKPLDISLEITLGSYQPIYTMSAQKNSLQQFSNANWENLEYFYRKDKSGLNFLSNYEWEDVWVARLNGNSSGVWGISPPSKEKLIEELSSKDNSVGVRLTWAVSRDSSNPNVQGIARGKGDEIKLTPENRENIIQMINGTGNSTQPIKIMSAFPKVLRVSNLGKAEVAYALNQALIDDRHWRFNKMTQPVDSTITNVPASNAVLRNLTLKLERSVNGEEWWVVEEDCNEQEKSHGLPLSDRCAHLNLYTFNEKAFPPTLSFISGGGIIGLYTTLVLVASKFVRGFFSGISFLIMFDDMPNVDRIFQLCLDIYLVRESGELALEEDLFAKLIFLYRSPETLIKWTRPKTEIKNE
ncbi:piezo-type mechanosensitive ion channel component isoform X2 [Folsomia candida]|uniref:piezo-type mechanosensitive ion channel component isoform X2 n=1 Tax=Folsomia candida TaxID=158441 RepID=UPI001604AF44|nr:piezo-type mechanosensitive ion channel component isoform X2 [Folsomia candida]